MTTLFRNKYRVESIRLAGWDYTAQGWYFVTICTKNWRCFLGKLIDEKIRLTKVGEIVAGEWQKIERKRLNIKLDEWVVMPNHIHGIISIEKKKSDLSVETSQRNVSTYVKSPRLQANSLGSIVGQFKSVCTKRIWSEGFCDFAWQPRFYDHIIRNERSLNNIRKYIQDNPVKWESDKNNPVNLLKQSEGCHEFCSTKT